MSKFIELTDVDGDVSSVNPDYIAMMYEDELIRSSGNVTVTMIVIRGLNTPVGVVEGRKEILQKILGAKDL